jgi:hypothetical protein
MLSDKDYDEIDAQLESAQPELAAYAKLRATLRTFPDHGARVSSDLAAGYGLIAARALIMHIAQFKFETVKLAEALKSPPFGLPFDYGDISLKPDISFRLLVSRDLQKPLIATSRELLNLSGLGNSLLHDQIDKSHERIDVHSILEQLEKIATREMLGELQGEVKPDFRRPLWPNDTLSVILEHRDLQLDYFFPNETGDFWKRWHNGFLDGRPLDWELQRRVALIPDDIWNTGPEAVAEEITRIEAQWLTEQAPLAETVALNPDTQKFHLIPTSVQNPPLTTTLVSRVQDALDDAMMGHNGLNERSTIARKLSRTFSRYADDPQRIEMDFTSAATSLRRQMYDTHDLPDSEDNLLLLETVEEGVRGIRAAHPDVAENRATLAGLAVQDLSEDDKATLAQAQPLLDAITEDTLQEDFAQDIPQLLNTSAGPLPSGAPLLPGVDASLRTFTRVSRIKLLIDKIGDWHEGKTHKAATMLLGATGIGKLLYELIQIGLKVLGVL